MADLGYSFEKDRDYEVFWDSEKTCRLHQLLACVENDPHEVFAQDTVVHHETGWKGDSRYEALAVMTFSEHNNLHRNGVWIEENGEPRLVMTENN